MSVDLSIADEWPKGDTCSACRFWEGMGNSGVCHRYPPTVDTDVDGYDCQPIAKPTDWCGEFKPRVIKVDQT